MFKSIQCLTAREMCTNLSHQFDTSSCLVWRLGFWSFSCSLFTFIVSFKFELYLCLWAHQWSLMCWQYLLLAREKGVPWDSLPLSNFCSRSLLKWLLVSVVISCFSTYEYPCFSVFVCVCCLLWLLKYRVWGEGGDFIANDKNLPRSGFQHLRDQ